MAKDSNVNWFWIRIQVSNHFMSYVFLFLSSKILCISQVLCSLLCSYVWNIVNVIVMSPRRFHLRNQPKRRRFRFAANSRRTSGTKNKIAQFSWITWTNELFYFRLIFCELNFDSDGANGSNRGESGGTISRPDEKASLLRAFRRHSTGIAPIRIVNSFAK